MNCGGQRLAQVQEFIKRLKRNKAGTYRVTKWVEEDEDDPQLSRSFKAESTPLLRREWPVRTRALGVYLAGHTHSIATMSLFNRIVSSIGVFH
jgi:hypothetical protein